MRDSAANNVRDAEAGLKVFVAPPKFFIRRLPVFCHSEECNDEESDFAFS